MFTEIVLENFLSFKGPTKVPLEKLTLLIGPNNSGKSNFLRALRFIGGITRAGLGEAAKQVDLGIASLPFSGEDVRSTALAFKAADERRSRTWATSEYKLRFEVGEGGPGITSEQLTVCPSSPDVVATAREFTRDANELLTRTAGASSEQWTRVKQVGASRPIPIWGLGAGEHMALAIEAGKTIGEIRYYHFSPATLRETSKSAKSTKLAADGGGLAGALNYLKSAYPDEFDSLERHFRECVPEIDRILAPPNDAGNCSIFLRENRFRRPFAAAEVSDGLLLFLALLCAIYTAPPPFAICIEEPERGIHPRRLRDLLELLYSICDGENGVPQTQIILTTHSPYFLDLFKDDLKSVLVFDKVDGATTVRRASDIAEERGGFKSEALGELWFSGILGGVPR